MDMKLELVPVPVSDVDRAKAFYVEQVGFNADLDVRPNDAVRIVQLTPPGSACSIVISTGLPEISDMQPGSVKALHLVVADIGKARQALAERGVKVGEIDEHPQGVIVRSFQRPRR
jgi:predicted enzyme related to lactoylglutathione lyase